MDYQTYYITVKDIHNTEFWQSSQVLARKMIKPPEDVHAGTEQKIPSLHSCKVYSVCRVRESQRETATQCTFQIDTLVLRRH